MFWYGLISAVRKLWIAIRGIKIVTICFHLATGVLPGLQSISNESLQTISYSGNVQFKSATDQYFSLMLFILLCNLVVWRESTEVNYKVVVICRMWSMLRVSKIPLVKSNFLDDVETTMSALYEQMLVKQSVEGTMTVSWRVQAVISFLQAVLSFSRCLQECTKMFYRFRFLFTSKCGEGVLVRSGQLIHLIDLSVCCNVSLPINLHVLAISLRKKCGQVWNVE